MSQSVIRLRPGPKSARAVIDGFIRVNTELFDSLNDDGEALAHVKSLASPALRDLAMSLLRISRVKKSLTETGRSL